MGRALAEVRPFGCLQAIRPLRPALDARKRAVGSHRR